MGRRASEQLLSWNICAVVGGPRELQDHGAGGSETLAGGENCWRTSKNSPGRCGGSGNKKASLGGESNKVGCVCK